MQKTAILVLATALTAPAAWSGTVDFSGAFSQDDNVQLFTYTVANSGQVTVSTTSFASGGFSPILTLFDSTGQFLFDDVGYTNNTDATLSWFSAAYAQYTVALTEYDNYANAANDTGNLSEGFTRDTQGNFTANDPNWFPTPQPGAFYYGPGGPQLTGNWAVTLSSPDDAGLSASELGAPEPASFGLALAGAALILIRKRFLRQQ